MPPPEIQFLWKKEKKKKIITNLVLWSEDTTRRRVPSAKSKSDHRTPANKAVRLKDGRSVWL